MSIYDTLVERGYIEQCTQEEAVRERLEGDTPVKFYIGFDPTADSLHIGHFIQIMVMAHMQRAGHIPVALIGGGTTMIGDPSGRSDLRQMMSQEQIRANGEKFRDVFEKFLTFEDGKAMMVNNADWLLDLNYIEFLRDIGANFSVNKMLTAECYKKRMEKGLTFLEFNYMLLQAYDFYRLYKDYGVTMEFGGNDQWSNILAGVDLVRRKEQDTVYGLTFSLLTTSEGIKMGKTAKGALWLDAKKTSPYEFYQYWRNIGDADVEKCLALLTFLPMEQVRELGALKDAEINRAKETLAYEVTKLIHGEEEAEKAQQASRALFEGGSDKDDIPTALIAPEDAADGIGILALLTKAGLAASNSEARRLVQQNGIAVDGEKVTDIAAVYTPEALENGLLVKKGKKVFKKVRLG